MTVAGQPPTFPWWVRYWISPTTTLSNLRQEAWMFFLLAGASIGIGALYLYWRPVGIGVVVLPVALGVFPVGFTVAGFWVLVAAGWIDRHGAWDRVTTEQEREAYEASRSLLVRSLPAGILLLAAGGVAGALVGWACETEVGIPVGVAFGALGGFMLGTLLAVIREGVRSSAGMSVAVQSQDAEPGAAPDRRGV